MAPRPDDDEAWDAEHILGVKKNLRKKTVELLVKWKGKPNSKNNWETIASVNGLTEDMTEPFDEAIETLKKNKRTDLDEEVEDKEMGQDEYVVEDILGIQWNADYRRLEYYIKWEGWDNQYNNWEPESNCDCDDLIAPFRSSADHLKSTYGPKNAGRKRAGPKSRTVKPASDIESDDEPVEKKRPGPKSKTVASKRPGPKSRTEAKPEPAKRPGPKSRTSAPGPASSKKPGPKSRTIKADSDDEEEKKVTRKSDSDSDDDAGGDKNGNSRFKKLSDSDEENDSDRASTPPAKKRPGPKSRTSAPGPASKKKPGPRSRTAKDDDGDDSD